MMPRPVDLALALALLSGLGASLDALGGAARGDAVPGDPVLGDAVSGDADPGDAALRLAYARPAGPAPSPDGDRISPPDGGRASSTAESAARAALGRRLFFSPALSADGTMSCASCHRPERGFSDGLARARGAGGVELPRRTPTLWNLGWTDFLFWDGRARGLEAQAEAPIEAHEEMGQDLGVLVARLGADPSWRAAFAGAFRGDAEPVGRANLGRALAAWERTLVSPRTRFDAWVEGEDAALDASERRGLALFHGPAGCAGCHSGWRFTDDAFYDVGLPDPDPRSGPGNRAPDLGRGPVLGLERLNRAFKVPTLRELPARGPFMHDGALPDLPAVIAHYERGVVDRPTLPPELPRRLALDDRDRADLLAFLATLGSPPGTPLPEAATPPTPVFPPAPAPTTSPARAPVARATVSQRGRRFDPVGVALLRGGTLEIRNDDDTAHNIRVDAPERPLNSGIQDPGQTVRWRFDRPGRFLAYCGIHPRMRLEVEVAEPPAR